MILSPKENAKIYGPKKAKRPSPKATFTRWWKTKMVISDNETTLLRGLTVGMLKTQSRRAWNAGRRAARKERN